MNDRDERTDRRTEWVVRGRWRWRPSWLILAGFWFGLVLYGDSWWFRVLCLLLCAAAAFPVRAP